LHLNFIENKLNKIISYKRYLNQKYLNFENTDSYLDKLINGKKHFWSTTGRNGLGILFDKLNFKKGDYIMLPAFVAHGIILPIKRRGLIPLYYKSNDDLSLNIDDVKIKIENNKVVAIFLIHYFGYSQNNDTIFQIAKDNNVLTIEDCAQALFSSYSNGKLIGVKGDVSLFSLTKFLPIPDGSLFIINNSEIDIGKINYKFSLANYFSVQFAKIQLLITKQQSYSKNFFSWSILDFIYKIVGRFHYFLICSEKKYVEISNYSKNLLLNINIESIIKQRKFNGYYVSEKLTNKRFDFYRKNQKEFCLTGLPILFPNKRKSTKKILLKKKIKTLVYNKSWWFIPDKDIHNFQNEYQFYQNHLLLPINENLDKKELDYMINVLNEL